VGSALKILGTRTTGRSSMTSSDQSESQFAKTLFTTLICAGYVYLAVFFYFMFNNIHSTPG
jgi:hypothetical protein